MSFEPFALSEAWRWPQVAAVRDLALEEAKRDRLTAVTIDQMLLALLRPECPGRGREVLESFGLNYEEAHKACLDEFNATETPIESPRFIAIPPTTQLVWERSQLRAMQMGSEDVRSEHVLFAIADYRQPHVLIGQLVARGVSRDDVIARIQALSKGNP